MTKGMKICSPCYCERARAYLAAQKAADPEVYREKKAKWRKDNREAYNKRLREPNRKWREANKERLKAAVKDWQARNPEKVEEYKRIHNERNKAKRDAIRAEKGLPPIKRSK
jgi:hypothetical protein